MKTVFKYRNNNGVIATMTTKCGTQNEHETYNGLRVFQNNIQSPNTKLYRSMEETLNEKKKQ